MKQYPDKIKTLKTDCLAYISEYEKKPLEQRFPVDTSYGLIARAGRSYPTQIAVEQLSTAQIHDQARQITFGRFAQKVTQTANLLGHMGITKTDAVSILLPTLMENQIALWGSQAAGIANPVNPFLEIDHIVEIMNEVKTRVLFTVLPSRSTELGAKVIRIIQQVPTLRHIVVVNDPGSDDIGLSDIHDPGICIHAFDQALEQQPADALSRKEPILGKDIAMYFHTGGTTGKPKIARLSHANIAFVAQIYADHNQHHGRAAVLNPLPLFHVFGVIAASLAVWLQGRTVVLMTPSGFRNPNVVKNWWYFVEQYQVSWFATVPTILSALLEVPIAGHDIGCLKYINSGSATLPLSLKNACAQKFDAVVQNGYGMTESSCLIARCVHGYESPEDTVGMPIPYTRVITAQVEDNQVRRICEPGEPGVILIKGPNVFKGYLDPKENEAAWVDGQWFNTGDIGILDHDGYLKLTGRARDLIIRGGHNIDPKVIETVLLGHPSVIQAVAVGQPDAYAGELPIAYVCLKKGCSAAEDELLEFCRTRIQERSAIPKRLEIVADIPRTAVGKIAKPILRNRATEYAVAAVLNQAGIQTRVKAEYNPRLGQAVCLEMPDLSDRQKAVELLKGFPVTVLFKDKNPT